jgi:hypothetical protein
MNSSRRLLTVALAVRVVRIAADGPAREWVRLVPRRRGSVDRQARRLAGGRNAGFVRSVDGIEESLEFESVEG